MNTLRYYRVWTVEMDPSVDRGLLVLARNMTKACEQVEATGRKVMFIVEDM